MFNVYGPQSKHKTAWLVLPFHLRNQVLADENPNCFGAYDSLYEKQVAKAVIHLREDLVIPNFGS